MAFRGCLQLIVTELLFRWLARFLFCSGMFAQCRHGFCGGIFALGVFIPSFALGDVVVLRHAAFSLNWRLGTPAPIVPGIARWVDGKTVIYHHTGIGASQAGEPWIWFCHFATLAAFLRDLRG
jgi:hypothetical protein